MCLLAPTILRLRLRVAYAIRALKPVTQTNIAPVAGLFGGSQREAAEGEAFVPALLILIVCGHFRAFLKAVHDLVIPLAFRSQARIAAIFPAELVLRRAGGIDGVKV